MVWFYNDQDIFPLDFELIATKQAEDPQTMALLQQGDRFSRLTIKDDIQVVCLKNNDPNEPWRIVIPSNLLQPIVS